MTAALSTSAALASPALEHRFAICAGLLSAQVEHQWLLIDPGREITEFRRDAMIDLLDAVSVDANRKTLMAIRIDAKQAHKALLQRATFNKDINDANWAMQRAQAQLRDCSGLLLI